MQRLLIAALALSFLVVGCREDDPIKPPDKDSGQVTDGTPPQGDGNTGNAKKVTIFQITDGTEVEGTLVELTDVIVTAVDGYGQYTGDMFVQESKGGPGAGLKLYRPARIDGGDISDLKAGDHVKVVGAIKYFTPTGGFNDTKHPKKIHIKELEKAQITRLGPGAAPTPVVLTAKDITDDPTAEGYESMLVQVKDVKVTEGVNSYGEIKVTGNLAVDDDLYPAANKKGDCISVTGVSVYFFAYKVNPRSAADIGTGTGCPVTKTVKISDIQDTTSANHPKNGDDVIVTGVITAVDSAKYTATKFKGFWIQEEGAGGPYKGIYVYHQWDSSSTLIPKEGDKIELNATYTEYNTLSELSYADWTVKGTAAVPAPVDVAAADVATGGSKAEEYEGVLVKVGSFKVDGYVQTTGSSPKDIGLKDNTSKLEVGSDLFDFMSSKPTVGTTYTSITGVMTSYKDKFTLLPRKAADLVP